MDFADLDNASAFSIRFQYETAHIEVSDVKPVNILAQIGGQSDSSEAKATKLHWSNATQSSHV